MISMRWISLLGLVLMYVCSTEATHKLNVAEVASQCRTSSREKLCSAIGLSGKNSIVPQRTTKTVHGIFKEKMKQLYGGLEVVGAVLSADYHPDEGYTGIVNGKLFMALEEDIPDPNDCNRTYDVVTNVAFKAEGVSASQVTHCTAQKNVYIHQNMGYLTYEVNFITEGKEPSRPCYFINACNLSVIHHFNHINHNELNENKVRGRLEKKDKTKPTFVRWRRRRGKWGKWGRRMARWRRRRRGWGKMRKKRRRGGGRGRIRDRWGRRRGRWGRRRGGRRRRRMKRRRGRGRRRGRKRGKRRRRRRGGLRRERRGWGRGRMLLSSRRRTTTTTQPTTTQPTTVPPTTTQLTIKPTTTQSKTTHPIATQSKLSESSSTQPTANRSTTVQSTTTQQITTKPTTTELTTTQPTITQPTTTQPTTTQPTTTKPTAPQPTTTEPTTTQPTTNQPTTTQPTTTKPTFTKNRTCTIIGGGTGGNLKEGKINYGIRPNCLDLTVVGSFCVLENSLVKVIDNWKNTLAFYSCAGDYGDAINGAYSPALDALNYGTQCARLFKDWYSMDPLKFKVELRVHHGTESENAYWDGMRLVFGDGKTRFYPLVVLDVVCHELGHGVTSHNSKLVYSDQSGGINEAFSDIIGETVKYYVRGSNDWLLGRDMMKNPSAALRYFADPPRDGVSIKHINDYVSGMSVHRSSGIFSHAFYQLVQHLSMPIRYATGCFIFANKNYWGKTTQFEEGACDVLRACYDLGYDFFLVKKAFRKVGITFDTCGYSTFVNTFASDMTRRDLKVSSFQRPVFLMIVSASMTVTASSPSVTITILSSLLPETVVSSGTGSLTFSCPGCTQWLRLSTASMTESTVTMTATFSFKG